jgi:hypothetical protein
MSERLSLHKHRCECEYENRVLRKMFAPEGEEVTRDWRKRHNETLNFHNSHKNKNIEGVK